MSKSAQAARNRERKQGKQRDQHQPDITRQKQQAEIEREQKPVTALTLPDRAPVIQQRQGPERRRQDCRTEIHARYCECGNSNHQQYGEHRMARADNRASQGKDRPIGDSA
jgi:hypothetical protein